MEQVKINVSKVFEEDTLINTFSFGFCGQRRRSKFSRSFIMETTNGCCTSPIRIGQSIRLKSGSTPIFIDKYTSIIYDVENNTWSISLPTAFIQYFDSQLLKLMEEYGFDTVENLRQ